MRLVACWGFSNNTVITRCHFVEQVLTGRAGRDLRQAVHQRRQVCWTSPSIQLDRHKAQFHVQTVKRPVKVLVNIGLVADRTGWRKPKVCGQNRVRINAHILTRHTLDKGARARVGRNNTVIAVVHFCEQVQTIGVCLHAVEA